MSSPFVSSWNGYGKFLVEKRASPLPTGEFALTADLVPELEGELRDFAVRQSKKAERLQADGGEEALLSIRYLFYYQEEDRLDEYLQIPFGKTCAEQIVQESNKANADPRVAFCKHLLLQLAAHPAMAYFSGCAIDELVTAQAEAFHWRGDKEVVDPLQAMESPALLFWLYLAAHKPERIPPTLEQGNAAGIWKVWHLFMLGSVRRTTPVLLGLTPDDSPSELSKLYTDAAFAKVFSPLVAIALARRITAYRGDNLAAVRDLLVSMFLYCEKTFPQLLRAFPDLVKWQEMIYSPTDTTRWIVCTRCKERAVTQGLHPSIPPSSPDVSPHNSVHRFGASAVFQWEVFNKESEPMQIPGLVCPRGHSEGFTTTFVLDEFPRFILLDMPTVYPEPAFTCGPSLKSGRSAWYRLYSRVSWNGERGGAVHSAYRKAAGMTQASWEAQVKAQPQGRAEIQVYERISPFVDV
jgi:hypothetical protein